MTHTYKINGMTCDGCRTKVENALNTIEGVQATVTLNPMEATITMEKHVPTEELQDALSAAGNYTIQMTLPPSHDGHHHQPH
ncbi:heavy-metal-associated domain-containing protein [Adhaeribacter radiodurans]|uniref:heavy-metal-associated domain-containing protein n=1 Tax=Adhaeribacter radiodurans TaxID=2745197 RepID=UPI001C717606|nr:heavy metal-associated domain-containing protein [Adhaeribacter radiodurans]